MNESPAPPGRPDARTSVAVVICTYRRNDPLRRLLDAVAVCAEQVNDRAAVAVVVVDDNPDGAAKIVVEEARDRFELGIHYRTAGHQNISLARNIAIETGAELAEWVAMTDDDCQPVAGWLDDYLTLAERTGADAVTGQEVLTAPEGAPSWLTDEPFLRAAMLEFDDGERVPTAGTNNSMISSTWLRAHPEVRFLPELGVLGGEDMVFYRTAERAGLHIRFSKTAIVHGLEPLDRATLRYQLRSWFWLGNTEAITNLFLGGVSRARLAMRAIKQISMGATRPLRRVASGERPQLRFGLASTLKGIGLLLGAAGVRLRHH